MTEQRAITAIDAALLEHQGKGVLSVSGKKNRLQARQPAVYMVIPNG